MKVAAFTAGENVPSARFRVHQHREHLARCGVDMQVFYAKLGAYPPVSSLLRPWWLPATLAQRIPAIVRSHLYDVTLLQRSMVSTLATLEGWTGQPRVFDVDDALWLRRGGGWVRRIVGKCDAVVCGNSFLADYFSQHNSNVHVVPTAVDTARFAPVPESRGNTRVIGWSGVSSEYEYLYCIEEALHDVLMAREDVRLRVMADRPPRFSRLQASRVEFVKWNPAMEAEAIRTMSVGLMPLRDSDWARGKCSYKMLLYLSCGVPAVVSPVGMNREVLAMGEVGHGATSMADWRDALLTLLDDEERARTLARNGRQVVEKHFSVKPIAGQIGNILRGVRPQEPVRLGGPVTEGMTKRDESGSVR
jgi:glycosyltransferase involved in cell wall biosynthesis